MSRSVAQNGLPPWTQPALALLVTSLLFLLHPYEGLIHDSRLYTLQALNHLSPELYGNDVFLRYGSQDSFTLFTPPYAKLVGFLGAERAASLVTFVSVALLLMAAWRLSRSLMPSRLAWLALGLFVVIPAFYGEGIVFSLIEGFMTPRMLAEAMVLLALAAWVRKKPLACILLQAAAFFVHPIMAFPGFVLLVMLQWGDYWRHALPLVGLVSIAVALALAGWVPLERWQLDDAWEPLAEWAPHLILTEWTLTDWARVATVLATLLASARCLPGIPGRLAGTTLLMTVMLLAVSLLAGDVLELALFVQGQAWRCLWLATAVSIILLPSTARECWSGPPLRRCALVFLATAWLTGYQNLTAFFGVLALVAFLADRVKIPSWASKVLDRAAWILLAVTVICMLAFTWSEGGGNADLSSPVAHWFQFLRRICDDRIIPAAVLLTVWRAAMTVRARAQATLLTAVLAFPSWVIGHESAQSWLREYYTDEARISFEPWRQIIPSGTDVIWAIRLIPGSDPTTVWLILQRPSYFSSVQFNSALFSRDAALELSRRLDALPRWLNTEQPVKIVYTGDWVENPMCADVPARYVITEVRIPDATVVPAPEDAPPPFDGLTLQICP